MEWGWKKDSAIAHNRFQQPSNFDGQLDLMNHFSVGTEITDKSFRERHLAQKSTHH